MFTTKKPVPGATKPTIGKKKKKIPPVIGGIKGYLSKKKLA